MDNQILHTIHAVRAIQLQAANLICLLVAFIALKNRRNNDDYIQVEDSTPSPPEQSSNAKKIKSKKRKLEQKDEALISKLINCIDNVANAIREGNKILERVYRPEYTGGEIYKELELMGLEPHEMPKAINYLAANQAKARALFSCPPRIRMDVLAAMMGAGN